MSTRNPNQLAPGISFPERAEQVIEVTEALPTRNRLQERAGQRFASEGTSFAPNIRNAFGSGFVSVRNEPGVFEVQIAGQATHRVEPGATMPSATFDAVDRRTLDSFSDGVDDDLGRSYPPGIRTRVGADNPHTISPLFGLERGERPANTIVIATAPEQGGRARRNVADVSDLERF